MIDFLIAKRNGKDYFFKAQEKALKQRDFVIWIITFIALNAYNALFASSVPYFVRYILKGGSDLETFIFLSNLIPMLVPIPVFIWLARKYEPSKIYNIVLLLIPIVLVFALFVDSLFTAIICIIPLGIGVGAINVLIIPMGANLYDEIAVINRKRMEGVYGGILTFFSRIALIIQVITFWLVHDLTRFIPDAETQTSLALWGIQIKLLLIPMIILITAAVIFTKWWDLTSEKAQNLKAQLKELDI